MALKSQCCIYENVSILLAGFVVVERDEMLGMEIFLCGWLTVAGFPLFGDMVVAA